jgi:hypothetical protein
MFAKASLLWVTLLCLVSVECSVTTDCFLVLHAGVFDAFLYSNGNVTTGCTEVYLVRGADLDTLIFRIGNCVCP